MDMKVLKAQCHHMASWNREYCVWQVAYYHVSARGRDRRFQYSHTPLVCTSFAS